MEYRLQSMYNHMVGRTVSVVSPFYSLLPGLDPSIAQVKTRVLDGLKFSKNQPSWGFLSLRLESSGADDRKFSKIFYICTFKISGIICGVKFLLFI